jgi:ribonuclease HI
MAKNNFYAVKKGRKPGIYGSWAECQENTSGFPGAVFKGFPTLEEAQKYMDFEDAGQWDGALELPQIYAFTDGSFNASEGIYGYGGFLHYSEDKPDIEIRGNGSDPEEATSRNVAGEVHGAVAAMQKAVELGLPELTIFYDYEGVAKWPTGLWKANKKISQFYVEEYGKIKDVLKVKFVHVNAHTGIPGNEAADAMAKEEVGLGK